MSRKGWLRAARQHQRDVALVAKLLRKKTERALTEIPVLDPRHKALADQLARWKTLSDVQLIMEVGRGIPDLGEVLLVPRDQRDAAALSRRLDTALRSIGEQATKGTSV